MREGLFVCLFKKGGGQHHKAAKQLLFCCAMKPGRRWGEGASEQGKPLSPSVSEKEEGSGERKGGETTRRERSGKNTQVKRVRRFPLPPDCCLHLLYVSVCACACQMRQSGKRVSGSSTRLRKVLRTSITLLETLLTHATGNDFFKFLAVLNHH